MYAIKFISADGPSLFLAGSEDLPYLASGVAEARQFPDATFAQAALREALAVAPRLAARAAEVVKLW